MPSSPLVSETLLLAAINRAERHQGYQGAANWAIYEHLAVPMRSAAARQARRLLDALSETGALKVERRGGFKVWALTPKGRKHLEQAEDVPDLPESPQHARWREARALATEEVERIHDALRETLEEALALTTTETPSDTWFLLAERLRISARRLGVVTYCIHEWAEPSDDRADRDDHIDPSDAALPPPERKLRQGRRSGRRKLHPWSESD
jgi:hypothetical protein